MTERVLLHVGAMKTGTSYLQKLMEVNRDSLLEAGVLVAPQRSAAVHDLTDHASRGQERLEQVRGTWDRVARKLRKAPQRTAVLSHEFLGLADPDVVRRALASFKGAEVHVLVTVRDASAVLPAQWQSAARNKGTLTWPEYASGAREGAGRGHTFLRAQRVGRMLRRWGEGLGPDALHVVTVPRPGALPDLLWKRVAGVLEVDPAVAPERDVRTNPSAGYATAHLLCLLHQAAERSELPVAQRRRLLVFLAEAAVARRDAEGRPPLDEETLAFCARWNARVRDCGRALRRRGRRLLGRPARGGRPLRCRAAGPPARRRRARGRGGCEHHLGRSGGGGAGAVRPRVRRRRRGGARRGPRARLAHGRRRPAQRTRPGAAPRPVGS